MTRARPARATAPPPAARTAVGSLRREWLEMRRSTKPSPASSTRAMTMSTRVPSRIMVMSRWRMAVLNRPPRPPPPTKAAKTAVPMALTAAMRMPVRSMGVARGISMRSRR